MKKYLSTFALALLSLSQSTPLFAAQQFPSYEAAQEVGKKEGYILFIYPAGWDKYGEKLCRKLIANDKVRAAAGNSALILAPMYQKRTDKTNAEVKQIFGKLGAPGDMSDISYPAIVFYETDGRMYATICGESLMSASEAEVAKLISKQLAAREKQAKLLQQAHASKDPKEKNRLFLAAARVVGMGWPPGLKGVMNQVDPEDHHGCRAALEFGFGVKKDEKLEDFLKRLDGVLKNDLLTPWQKQRACATAIGHIRRTLGSMAGGPLITKYAKAMHKLDPKSALGISAPVVMRDWVKTYHYGNGWSDQIIPAAPVPMLMHDVPMSKPGTYNISFKLTTGRDGIIVKRLRLLDGNKCVATHDTPCEISWSAGTQKSITLTVKKAVKEPVLEITYGNDPNKRSTWGNITITPQ